MASSLSNNTADNVGLVPCSNHEPISTADTDTIENSNPVSYLGDETLCISNEIFFKLLQDPETIRGSRHSSEMLKKTTQCSS